MTSVLFDTNIILDIALQREPFFEDAFLLFDLIDKNQLIGYVTASTITDIYYIAKRQKGHESAIAFIKNLTEVVEVVAIDKEVITLAFTLEMKDFEDAIQTASAELNEIEVVITRNKKDFINAPVKVLTPKEYLSKRNH